MPKGVEKNDTTALTTYLQVADQNNSLQHLAEVRVGNMYYYGQGIAQPDYKKALEYLTRGAEHSHELQAYAQFKLADMYHHAKGVTQDENTALEFLDKAAAQQLSQDIERKIGQIRCEVHANLDALKAARARELQELQLTEQKDNVQRFKTVTSCLESGKNEHESGQYEQAIQSYQTAITNLEYIKNQSRAPRLVAKAQQLLSQAQSSLSQVREHQEMSIGLDLLLSQLNQNAIPSQNEKAATHNDNPGVQEQAQQRLTTVKPQVEQSGLQAAQAKFYEGAAHFEMGNYYQDDHNDVIMAIDYYKNALKEFEALKETSFAVIRSDAHDMITQTNHQLDRLRQLNQQKVKQADTYCNEGDFNNALKILDEVDEQSLTAAHRTRARRVSGVVHFNLGALDLSQARPDSPEDILQYSPRALKHFEQAAERKHPLQDDAKTKLAETLLVLGQTYHTKKDYNQALQYLEKAAKLAWQNSYPQIQAEAHYLLGKMYYNFDITIERNDAKTNQRAMNQFLKAHKAAKTAKDKKNETRTAFFLGEMYRDGIGLKEYNLGLAIEYFEIVATQQEELLLRDKALYTLGKIYLREGAQEDNEDHISKALEYFQRAATQQDNPAIKQKAIRRITEAREELQDMQKKSKEPAPDKARAKRHRDDNDDNEQGSAKKAKKDGEKQ